MALKTQTIPENAGFLASIAPGSRSLDQRTIKTGENLKAGAVLAGVDGTVTATAAAGNTGDGTFAATPVGVAGVVPGDYRLVIIETVAAAGAFALFRPDGSLVGTGNVAAAFSNELSFTLQDGATDFVAGDEFTITVEDPKMIERAAGIHASGVLYQDTDASAADKKASVVVRDAEVVKAELVHFTAATDAEKDAALRALAAAGIIGR